MGRLCHQAGLGDEPAADAHFTTSALQGKDVLVQLGKLGSFYEKRRMSAGQCGTMLSDPHPRALGGSDAAALDLFRSRPAPGFSNRLMLQLARKAGHSPPGALGRGLGKVEGTHNL